MPTSAPRPLTAAQAGMLQRAFGLLQSQRPREALPIARRLASEALQAPDAHQLLAMCLAETGDSRAAEAAFRRALELAPDHPLILSNFAAMLRKAGRAAESLPMAQRIVELSPASTKSWIDLGNAALAAGDAPRAMAAARQALRLEPGAGAAWLLLGHAARRLEDQETAEAAFGEAVRLQPALRPGWIGLGMAQRHAGRPDDAVASLERAVRASVSGPEVVDALVGALLDAGRIGEAMALARDLVREHPDFVPGLVTLANLLWEYQPRQQPGADPADLFRAAIARQPGHAAMRMAFARFLLSTRAPEEALEQIRGLRAHADRAPLALMEAAALDMLGRAEAAGELHARLHASAEGRSPAFLNAYARHLLAAGDPELAAAVATEATRIDPHDQEAWAYLATAWRLLDDAREFWLCDYERLIGWIEIEPPAPFCDLGAFLDALTRTLEPMHRAHHEPMQQSLRAGSQTPGRLFGRPDPTIAAARQALLRGVERWLASLPDDDAHPFLRRKRPSVRIGGSWSVKLWSSGRHANHIHGEGWMSSAFYVALPESVRAAPARGEAAGAIQFGQPPDELGLELPPRRVIAPEAGKLALFPSCMWHGTVPFHDQAPRLTIAFDMIPRAERA